MITLSFHALWMLCALGSVVFAAAAGRSVGHALALAAGVAAGAAFIARIGLPDPAWVGSLAVGAIAIYLFRPRYALVSAFFGGTLAGLLSGLLQEQGLPFPAAVLIACALIGASAWLARTRPRFAPALLLDEGLLAVAVIGVVTAALPSILDGWQAAGNLAVGGERQGPPAVPMSTLMFLLVSTLLGALYSSWSRR
jgi:hypothetical protein